MIRTELAKILSSILDVPIEEKELKDNTNLINEFGLSSLDMLHFILEIENCLAITIDLAKFDVRYFYEFRLLQDFIQNCQINKC